MQRVFMLVVMCYIWQPAFPQHEHYMPEKKDAAKLRSQVEKGKNPMAMQVYLRIYPSLMRTTRKM